MARRKQNTNPGVGVTQEELAEAVSQDTAQLELEKLQKKIAREERKQRREIEANKQKQAKWLLPMLLFVTMLISWMLSKLAIETPATSESATSETLSFSDQAAPESTNAGKNHNWRSRQNPHLWLFFLQFLLFWNPLAALLPSLQ